MFHAPCVARQHSTCARTSFLDCRPSGVAWGRDSERLGGMMSVAGETQGQTPSTAEPLSSSHAWRCTKVQCRGAWDDVKR
jgi:hypothetical protein